MRSFLWILVLGTLALVKCSISENTHTELTDLKKQFSQLMVKQSEMEKEMKQMRIKYEVMEVQISQLRFANRQQRWDQYKNKKAVEKQLNKVKQQNNHLCDIISDLQRRQKEPETLVKLKSTPVPRTQKCSCEKETKPSQHRRIKQFLGHTKYRTHYSIDNHTMESANGSSDNFLHNTTTDSYLDEKSNENKAVSNKKSKRILIPATSVPDTFKKVVAFHAKPSQDISNVGDNQHLEFDKVLFSEGSEYDTTTGTFRCVIPGVYVFSVTMVTPPNKYLQTSLVRNGNPLLTLISHNDNRYDSSTNTAIVRLEAGDRVWVRVNGGNHYSGMVLDASFTDFTGYLLQS